MEISNYTNTVEQLSEFDYIDVEQFWTVNSALFEFLIGTARKYLCVPATSIIIVATYFDHIDRDYLLKNLKN